MATSPAQPAPACICPHGWGAQPDPRCAIHAPYVRLAEMYPPKPEPQR